MRIAEKDVSCLKVGDPLDRALAESLGWSDIKRVLVPGHGCPGQYLLMGRAPGSAKDQRDLVPWYSRDNGDAAAMYWSLRVPKNQYRYVLSRTDGYAAGVEYLSDDEGHSEYRHVATGETAAEAMARSALLWLEETRTWPHI